MALRIKRLEWFQEKGARGDLIAEDPLRNDDLLYRIKLWRDGRAEIVYPYRLRGVHKSKEIAMETAEAEHEAYIRNWLEVTE